MTGNARVDLIKSNLAAFTERYYSIRRARHSLDLAYYIWREDTSGVLLIDELLKAADRGVRVRLLLDALNFSGPDSLMIGLNLHENVEVRLYSPFYYGYLSPLHKFAEFCFRAYKLNRRLHIKCWMEDAHYAICGGRNIGDEYFGNKTTANFSDLDVALYSTAAEPFQRFFEEYWSSHYVEKIERVRGLQPRGSLAEFRAELTSRVATANGTPFAALLKEKLETNKQDVSSYQVSQANLAVVWDPPAKVWFQSRQRVKRETTVEAVLRLISGATHEIKLVSPYFIPGPRGSRFLLEAAHQGRDVGILTNSLAATDAIAAHSGSVKYRQKLVRSGVRLYELKPTGRLRKKLGILPKSRSSLHAKYIIIDGRDVFIGSFNLDPRSAWLNCEAGVVVRHEKLAADLLAIYSEAIHPANSWRLELNGKELHWHGVSEEGDPECFTTEPEASWTRKMLIWFFSLLPIEPLL